MKCGSCGIEVAEHETRCHVCMSDVGFPNVRAAQRQEETDALEKRLNDAVTSATARGCEKVLADFGTAVKKSSAVVSRPLGVVKNIIESDNQLITTFYGQVASGSRIPEGNRFDRSRPGVDGTMFPFYHEKINFGVLSLDGIGVGGSYGACHLTLKESAISQRATVFEENSFLFCTVRHRIIVGGRIPSGYRATWGQRYKLASAKHQSDLDSGTVPAEFARILVKEANTPEAEVFLEVHIFGPMHCEAVAAVACKKPPNGPDSVIWNSLKKGLSKRGTAVTELP